MARDASNSCILCNKADAHRCQRCKSSSYCSKSCQQIDWSTHKLLCATFSSFDSSSRPSNESFRAILFPVDDKNPKLVWLRCTWRRFGDDEDDADAYQKPEVTSFLGPDACERDAPIQYNPVLKRKLSDTIYICHRDSFLVDGSKTNNSIAGIMTTTAGQKHDWRGPVIAYGKVGLNNDPTFCRDLDMNDFRHIADYFLSYNANPAPASQKPLGPKIKGVRINCVGDQKRFDKPHFEAVEVFLTDLIFSDHDTSDIADRIGLPIFTRRCPPDPEWLNKAENENFDFNNQDATFLHLCCDRQGVFDIHSGNFGWGFASQQWQNRVGSAIVVRQDKKPLLPLHAEALCKYCRHEIGPLFAHSNGEYTEDDPLKKEAVLAMICRPTFVIRWYKLLDEKHEKWLEEVKKGKNTKAEHIYNAPDPYEL